MIPVYLSEIYKLFGQELCGEDKLITGVSTDSDHRGKGEGRVAVLRLAAALYPRKVFAEATENTAKFYEKCGFERSQILCRARS